VYEKLIECFFCKGPCLAWDFPKKGKLSALRSEEEDEEPKQEKKEVQLGTLNLRNSIKTRELPKKPASMSLPIVEVKVNNTELYTLVDMGASNMFMSNKVEKGLGL